MKKNTLPVLLLLASILLGACAATPEPPQALPALNLETPLPTATLLVPATATEDLMTPEPMPGAVPQAAFAARAALAEMLGVNADHIEIRNIEPNVWPDGCLGLGGPAENCLQAIVSGYRITLAAGVDEYIFRANESGSMLRREMTPLRFSPADTGEETRLSVTWQNPDCTEEANLLPEGLSYGACGGPYTLSPWSNGATPGVMLEFLDTFAPFEAATPAGKLVFNGTGATSPTPAEQRAIAEWMKIQFLAAQSGRPQADWGLALVYSRQGGFAGFCDEMKIYLDGSVLLSSCKDVTLDVRLDAEQLSQLYAWYDSLEEIDATSTDPALADAMTTKLVMPAQGNRTVNEEITNEILAFCAELVNRARAAQ